MKMADFEYFHALSMFLWKNLAKCIEYGKYCSDSQIDKPQLGCPKRTELPDVNINTGAQPSGAQETHCKQPEFFCII